MAAGDVVAEIVTNATAAKIDTTVTALRNAATDTWLMCSLNGQDVLIVNIEEA